MPALRDIVVNCNYGDMTELCKIMYESGSDKSVFHTYTRLYSKLFEDIRYSDINLFEVGMGTKNPTIKSHMCGFPWTQPGGSLRGWKNWFPNAHIYGADIDKDILFKDDRISTFYTDQTDPNVISNMWKEIGDVEFDIIIDDGLHEFNANWIFMMNSYQKLKKGGLYVIEDVSYDDAYTHHKMIEEYKKMFSDVVIVQVPGTNHIENTLVILRV